MSRRILLILLSVGLLSQAVLAESASYHLKRVDIQARAFLAQMEVQERPQETEDVSVEKQLESSVNNESTWAEDMVREDLLSVVSTVPNLMDSIKSGNTDEYSKARAEVESLARRLRISTSALQLEPQEQANLELLMLELDEASSVLSQEREQLAAQREARSRRSRVHVGVGYGYGWGNWGPWGPSWGVWNRPYYYGGYYRPHRVYRRPIHR
ncbi:MAG: hypothetical protein WC314_20745 [Vulcanimicrobiota bacterium]